MTSRRVTDWSPEEEDRLAALYSSHASSPKKWDKIGKEMGKAAETCRSHWRLHGARIGSGRVEATTETSEASRVEYSDNNIYVVQASRRVMSQEELMEAYNIDPDKWRVEKYTIRTSEGYRKDRKVSWHVVDGRVTSGDVEDSGKMLVVPLYHMELRLVRKQEEVRARDAVEDMIRDAKVFAPKYPKVKYAVRKDKMLYEIAMPDIHFGRLTWHEESGEDYDIKLADVCVGNVLEKLLGHARNYNLDKILLPINGDYFNVDNKMNVTSHGTPQNEDTRYQKTFRRGRELMVKVIDACTAIAPVDVLIVKGNHDEEKSFYLGDALYAWYHNNPNVKIDNGAKSRKYYPYGSVLLGFTHGYYEKLDKLPLVMAMEVPELWGKSNYREIHTGDKHHKRDISYNVNNLASESTGVVVRILRSLAPADAWLFNKGFVGALRAAEAFLWDEDGLVAQFTATPK